MVLDAIGNPTSITDPLGNTETRGYNRDGELIERTDARGSITRFEYDPRGRNTAVIDANGHRSDFGYTFNGELASTTTPRGGTTTYTYDGVGRRTSTTDPTGSTWTMTYDANGNLTRTRDAIANASQGPAAGTTDYTYDTTDQLVEIAYSDGTDGAIFAYDENGNRTEVTEQPVDGCPITGCETHTFTYDNADRLTRAITNTDIYIYSYDNLGRLASRGLIGAPTTSYGYDAADQLTSAAVGDNTTSYEWDQAGNLSKTVHPNGLTTARQHDKAGRLTASVTNGVPGTSVTADYTYNEVGQPTRIETDQEVRAYTYDPRGQLTSACFRNSGACATPTHTYGYDANGNRTSENTPDGTLQYQYNLGDRLTRITGDRTANPAFDANGRLTGDGTATYEYNTPGDLLTTTSGGSTTNYTYDVMRNRLTETTDVGTLQEQTTTLSWDLNNPVPRVAKSVSLPEIKTYHYGIGLISENDLLGNAGYFHAERDGSTGALTDPDGQITQRFAYEPYGNTRTATVDTGTETQMKFTGEHQDALGRYNLRARIYDPTSGRFDRPDPLDPVLNSAVYSTFLYANNQPTALVDPTGMRPSGVGQKATCGVGFVTGFMDPLLFGAPTAVADGIAGLFNDYVPQECSGFGQSVGNWYWPLPSLAAGPAGFARTGTRAAGSSAATGPIPGSSVWSLGPSVRGFDIEKRLSDVDQLPYGFKTIDRHVNGTAISIKSLDINASSYQSASQVRSVLRKYVDKLAGYNGSTLSGVTIKSGRIQARRLDVAIPPGATAAQTEAIRQVKNYASSKGVQVNVVVMR